MSSLQLSAFFQVAKLKSFSKAASAVSVTQSALSQRIANLEADLEVTLFIRDPSGLLLTRAGEELLRYCQITDSLEQEVLGEIKSSTGHLGGHLAGTIRIGAFSSVLRSAVIPSLSPFLRDNPGVHCEFRSYSMGDLPNVLRSAEADFILLDYQLNKNGIVEDPLGNEEYVVIESARHKSPNELYLDHGPEDNATESYFRKQPGAPKTFRRSFMGDVYGIIEGVEQGLGRAVMSRHLVTSNGRVRILKGYKPYFRQVTLNYFEQPYYSKLHLEVIKQLKSKVAGYL